MPRGGPKVAQVEDYDSDASAVKAGTRKVAQRRSTTSGPPKSMERYRTHRATGSDSGYSSQTTGTQESRASIDARAMPPPPRPSTTQPQTSAKTKPVLIQRTSSQRNRERAPSKSPTKATFQPKGCNDPSCRDPNCGALDTNRQNSMQQYPVQYSGQYASSPSTYQQQPYQYPYQQPPVATPTQNVPAIAQPRPRTGSSSQQPRPVSFGGYNYQSYPVGTPSGGPPPSASAYQNQSYQAQMLAWQNWQMQQQGYPPGAAYGTTPPVQPYQNYAHASPVAPSPIVTHTGATPGLQRNISARAIDGNPSGGVVARTQPQAIPSARTQPARRLSARVNTLPGSFPVEESTSSESAFESESESESEYSEQEEERLRRRARDSRLMSSSSQRRPSLKATGRHATEPVVPTRSSRDVLRRNPRSDYMLEDILSSDNMDSDKTTRAVAGKSRTTYTGSSQGSRQQSLSTNASSRRTKTTAPSSLNGGSQLRYEDSKGRPVSYWPKRDQEELSRRLQAQRLDDHHRRREDDVEAYQDKVRGARQTELTAETLRKQQHRASNSHASGHTRQSSRSSSKAGGDGFKIDYGGTVLHVYGDTKVELQAGEDGAPGKMIIGGSSAGKDSAYHSGSKSSSSRVGRSRGGSERGGRRRERSIREEDGYEPAL